MKKILLCFSIITVLVSNIYTKNENLQGFKVKSYPFFIYSDASHKLNHFYPGSMWGDFFHIKMNDKYIKNPKTGKTCIQIKYTTEEKSGNGWAQISFQPTPSNYWNSRRGSYDLTTAKKLFFYAKGEKGNEIVEFRMVGIKGRGIVNKDISTGEVKLTKNWKLYAINISNTQLQDIAGGIAVIFSRQLNPKKCTIYVDHIYYLDKSKPINLNKNRNSLINKN